MTHLPCIVTLTHAFDVFGVTQPSWYQQDSTYIRHRFCMFCYVHQSHGPYLSQTLKAWKPFSGNYSNISLRSDGLITSVTSKSQDMHMPSSSDHYISQCFVWRTRECYQYCLTPHKSRYSFCHPTNFKRLNPVWITWALSCNGCLFLFLFGFILTEVAVHFLSVQCVSIAFPKQQGSASKAKKDEEYFQTSAKQSLYGGNIALICFVNIQMSFRMCQIRHKIITWRS